MLNEAAEHHKKAAEHHQFAAHHHKEAAKYHETGFHEKALYHARLAHEHHAHAAYHASKGASSWRAAPVDEKAMKTSRGLVPCSSCDKSFIKTLLTRWGQCQSCAEANKPRKVGGVYCRPSSTSSVLK